jgi:hypothetical protein
VKGLHKLKHLCIWQARQLCHSCQRLKEVSASSLSRKGYTDWQSALWASSPSFPVSPFVI